MRSRVIIIIVLLFIVPIRLFSQEKVLFSNNYPPYNYTDESGKLTGFNIEILETIAKLFDEEIIIEGGQWDEINKAFKSGECSALGGTNYPGTPGSDYFYTRTTMNTSHCFLYNTQFIKHFSIEFLRTEKNPHVVLWNNDVLVHYLLSINPNITLHFVKDYEELITLLDDEEITCGFGQRISSMYYAKKYGKNYIHPSEHRILERSMGFKVLTDSPELAKLIDDGIEIITANGVYQELHDKWISGYDKNQSNWQSYLKYILISGISLTIIFFSLLGLNWALRNRVKKKTADLSLQLELNSKIMEELEVEKNRAEESDRMKSAFLANMSHEIRTPMNGILGFADLLMSSEYSREEQLQYVNIIQQSGTRMLETINNIIDVSKLEAGMEKIEVRDIELQKMMNELYKFFNREADAKGLKLNLLKIESSDDSYSFASDEYKLNSILTNLIKNAIKFTPDGLVDVKYSIDSEFAQFWIKDTGVGIEKSMQAAIFNEFTQADDSYSRGFEGSGLGLSISKGYVELLGGRIELKSEINVGSEFYVAIPNKCKEFSKCNGQKKETESINSEPYFKYKFIIAEDDDTSYLFLKKALKSVTERMIRAENGLEAVELAKRYDDTDVILMDVKMPKMNGLEATEKIRSFNKNVMIIAQTAYAQENYQNIVREAGCDSYITKPVNKSKLLSMLNSVDVEEFSKSHN